MIVQKADISLIISFTFDIFVDGTNEKKEGESANWLLMHILENCIDDSI